MTPEELDIIQAHAPPGHVLKGMWSYQDADGTQTGIMARYERIGTNGGEREKTYRPFITENGELVCKGFQKPHPLYGLETLAKRPDDPVGIVEGEKAADAARLLLPERVWVTSPHGSKAAAEADWSPLAGRPVIIWPDHDAAGIGYAIEVAKAVPGAKVVQVPNSFPEKWDVADDMPEGVTPEILAGLLHMAEAPPAPQAKRKRKTKDDLHKSVEEVKRDRDALIDTIKAMRNTSGRTEKEAKSYTAKAKQLMAEHNITDDDLEFGLADVEEDDFGTEETLRQSAAGIIASENVLEHFAAAWRMMVAGEERNAKLLYLAATSRLFDRCMHAGVKGPSSAGKSEIRKRVLAFFPLEHVISFSTMTEKALFYFEQDFCHLILSMGEAHGQEEQQLQDYLLRELSAFADPSGGSSDSMTLAIGHREGNVAMIDAIRERKPPFRPDAVALEFAELLRSYRVGAVTGDRYGGEWPRDAFKTPTGRQFSDLRTNSGLM
jgi:hypothetical protein